MDPFKHYRQFIALDTESFYNDDEIAIASINTVRPLTIENGAVAQKRIGEVTEWFSQFPDSLVKIVVTHHPLHRNPTKLLRRPAWHAKDAVTNLSFSGVDAFLSGHLHRTAFSRPGVLSVHAGTVSERLRGEPASFNVISIDIPHMIVEKRTWDSEVASFKKSRSTALLIKNKFKKSQSHTQQRLKNTSV